MNIQCAQSAALKRPLRQYQTVSGHHHHIRPVNVDSPVNRRFSRLRVLGVFAV